MKTIDIVRTALRNAARGRLRAALTVLSLALGAFTLTLTIGIGAGIDTAATSTVASIGSHDVMPVSQAIDRSENLSRPTEYDPDQTSTAGSDHAPNRLVLVLDAVTVLALTAAAIGIANTLFTAVQERTREVGLMKAFGLSSARVFSLFGVEAAIIGLTGSLLGVGGAIVVGTIASSTPSSTALADLPGQGIVSVEPAAVAAVILGITAIAFLAGTLPALRAARQDPVSSLHCE